MLFLQFEKVNICQWNHNKRLKFFNTVNNKENYDKRENVKSIDSKKKCIKIHQTTKINLKYTKTTHLNCTTLPVSYAVLNEKYAKIPQPSIERRKIT